MGKSVDVAFVQGGIHLVQDTEWTGLGLEHGKVTMSVANVLYGITMQEPGVSKRVAVKFEDIERKVAWKFCISHIETKIIVIELFIIKDS